MTDQLTEQDLKRMSPEQIVDAHRAGRFDELLSNPKPDAVPPDHPNGPITDPAWLAHMSADEIVAAEAAGRLNTLLGRPDHSPSLTY